MRVRSPRPILAVLCFAAIVLARVEPELLSLPFVDRAPLAKALAHGADRDTPEYARFLEGVRSRTAKDSSIVILFPRLGWSEGYSYAYYRASYLLAGREVLPLVTPQDLRLPQNLALARYMASWRTPLPPTAHRPIWEGEGGMLLER
jgi:hypothetical protein